LYFAFGKLSRGAAPELSKKFSDIINTVYIKRKRTGRYPKARLPRRRSSKQETVPQRRGPVRHNGRGGLSGSISSALRGKEKTASSRYRIRHIVSYPASRNQKFTLDRPLTDENVALRYNNFYEFSADKNVWLYSDSLEVRPWQ
jgi:sulfoxide reductase catalytic subunit YedY